MNLSKVSQLGDIVYLVGSMSGLSELFVHVVFEVVSSRPGCVTCRGTTRCSLSGEQRPICSLTDGGGDLSSKSHLQEPFFYSALTPCSAEASGAEVSGGAIGSQGNRSLSGCLMP